MARARKPATTSQTKVNSGGATSESADQFTCPECGRVFSRAAALGAHRKAAHGVAGSKSSRARTRSRASNRPRKQSTRTLPGRRSTATATRSNASRDGSAASVNRDALLAVIFPQGIPPRENVIRALNSWLDDAERLTRMH
jgi:predicted RNA-binding Zn-ribbon protein involved in translation (DUF1610 family)